MEEKGVASAKNVRCDSKKQRLRKFTVTESGKGAVTNGKGTMANTGKRLQMGERERVRESKRE